MDFTDFQAKWSDHMVRSLLTSCWELALPESLQHTLGATEVKQSAETDEKSNEVTQRLCFFITLWLQILNMAFTGEI